MTEMLQISHAINRALIHSVADLKMGMFFSFLVLYNSKFGLILRRLLYFSQGISSLVYFLRCSVRKSSESLF